MNREDPASHQGQYRTHFQHHKHNNRGGYPAQSNAHPYKQGAPREDNQTRKQFSKNSRRHPPWYKNKQKTGERDKTNWTYNSYAPYKAISQPPKPKSPQPGSEEFVQRQSGALLKQMEECPDAEFVMPPITSTDNQVKEETSKSVRPTIGIFQETTAVEHSNNKLNTKRAAQQAQQAYMKSAYEIAEQIRQLKRQERVKVCRDIRRMYNEKNPQCKESNAIIPDISIKVEALPPEFRNTLLDFVDGELQPQPGDIAAGDPQPYWHYKDGENSNLPTDGDAPYNPLEAANCDSSSQDQYNWSGMQQPPAYQTQPPPHQEQPTQTIPNDDTRELSNAFEMYGRNAETPQPEYFRMVTKCHIKPGRPESRAPGKVKLKRAHIDASDTNFNSMQTAQPVPPPPPIYSNAMYNIPPDMNNFNALHNNFTTPPPPLIIGPQMEWFHSQQSCAPVYDNRPVRQSKSRRIRVQKEASEAYNPRDQAASRNSRHDPVHEIHPDQFVDDELLFRASFDIKGSSDDWNRNIIVKSQERVLKEMALENQAYADIMRAPDPDIKVEYVRTIETNMQNGKDLGDFATIQYDEQAEKVAAQVQRQADEEELDYEASFSDEETDENKKPVEPEEVLTGEEVSVPSIDEVQCEDISSIPSVEELPCEEVIVSISSVDEVSREASVPSVEELPFEELATAEEVSSGELASVEEMSREASVPSVEELASAEEVPSEDLAGVEEMSRDASVPSVEELASAEEEPSEELASVEEMSREVSVPSVEELASTEEVPSEELVSVEGVSSEATVLKVEEFASSEEGPSEALACVEEVSREASVPMVEELTSAEEVPSEELAIVEEVSREASVPMVEKLRSAKEVPSEELAIVEEVSRETSVPSVDELASAEEVPREGGPSKPVPELIVEHTDATLPEVVPEPQPGGVKLKANCSSVIVLEATSQPGTYIAAKKGKLGCKNVTSTEEPTENPPPKAKANEVSEAVQTEHVPVKDAKESEKKPALLSPKSESVHSHSHRSDRKRSHSKSKSSSSTSKCSRSSHSSKSKSSSRATSRSHSSSVSKGHPHEPKKKTEAKKVTSKSQQIQIETDTTDIGKLRARYNRHIRNTRQLLSKLNVIDKKIEDLLVERRGVVKALNELASTSESDEERPVAAVQKAQRRRGLEADAPPVTPVRLDNIKTEKEVPTRYIYIRGDSSATPSTKNPVLNSDPASEPVLTKVLHSEDYSNPESPPDFLMHSMEDIDIFSMISEPRGKAAAEPVEVVVPDETYTEDSNPVSQSDTADMEIDAELGVVMKTTETMPADILEPSDNECMDDSPLKNHTNNNPFVKLIKYNVEDLQRIKHGLAQKSTDEFVPHSNNNVKIEVSELSNLEPDVSSEFFGNEVNVNTEEDSVVDFVGWKDSILVIKVIKDLIVAGNDQGKLYYFDTQSAYPIFSETLSLEPITSIIVYDIDQYPRLFIGSLDKNLYVYDVDARQTLKIAKVGLPIQCLTMGWMCVYMGSARGDLIKYCMQNGRMSIPVNVSEEAVLDLKCVSEEGRRALLVAIRNAPITIRDASNALVLRTIGEEYCSTVYSLLLHNTRIYCGTSHDDVLAFNYHDGEFLFKHDESRGSGIVCMATVRNLLFVASYNGHIYVYNTEDNTFITSISAPPGLLLSMAVTKTHLIAGTKQNFQCMLLPAAVSSLL